MFLHNLEYTTRMRERLVLFWIAFAVHFECPFGLIVGTASRIKTGKQTVFKTEIFAHNEGSVGVFHHVLFKVTLFVQDIVNHTTEHSDISTGAKRGMHIGTSRGTGKARINVDNFGTSTLSFCYPFKRNWMVLGRVTAHNQNAITVL